MKAFFIILGIIVLVAGGWYWVAFQTSADGTQIIFKGPERIFYGMPFELSVGVGNASGDVWNEVKLALSLPEGFVFAGEGGNGSFVVKQLGNLGDGSLTETSFMLMAVYPKGGEGAGADHALPKLEAVEAHLTYTPGGGSTVFEKNAIWQGVNPEAGALIALEAPEHVASGEELKLTVRYGNVTGENMEGVAVRLTYPPQFKVMRASADPDVGDTVWTVGTLGKGTEDSIVIFGRLATQGEENEFKAELVRTVRGTRYSVHEARALVNVESAPIIVAIDANDTPDLSVRLGETVNYTISYLFERALENRAADLAVYAMLDGSLFDMSTLTIDKGGFLRRDPKTGAPQIVWSVPRAEGEGGSVGFTIKVKPEHSVKRLGDRDFVLKINAEVQAGGIVGAAEHTVKVAGKIALETRGYFRDAASSIVNKGTMPPKVGAPTQYTIHWKLKNYATDVKKVEVRAPLMPGVRLTGTVKSTVDTKPIYDAEKNEVVWRMDRVSAATGVIGAGPEVIFQIEGIPTAGMVGNPMPLMGSAVISATDDFTSLMLNGSALEITTALPDDATVGNQGIVIP